MFSTTAVQLKNAWYLGIYLSLRKLVFKVLYFFYFIAESDKLLIILNIIPFNRRKSFYIIVGHGLGSSWLLFQLCTMKSKLIAYRIMLGWTRVFVLFLGWEAISENYCRESINKLLVIIFVIQIQLWHQAMLLLLTYTIPWCRTNVIIKIGDSLWFIFVKLLEHGLYDSLANKLGNKEDMWKIAV